MYCIEREIFQVFLGFCNGDICVFEAQFSVCKAFSLSLSLSHILSHSVTSVCCVLSPPLYCRQGKTERRSGTGNRKDSEPNSNANKDISCVCI